MTTPVNLADIQTHLPNVYSTLQTASMFTGTSMETFDQPLKELSSGFSMEVNGNPTEFRIGWHRDETDKIQGLFLRIYNQNSITAYRYTNSIEMISIENHQTTTSSSNVIAFFSMLQPLITQPNIKDHPRKPTCQIEHLGHPEKIQDFFKNNPDMLPQPVRDKVFPSTLSSKYIYLIGGLILTIGVIYLAKKYFKNPKTTKA